MTPDPEFDDSLDRIERQLAIEEALIDRINDDKSLTQERREELIGEILDRMERGDFPEDDDWDDGSVAALVRQLGPKSPKGRGSAVHPEEELKAPDEPYPPVIGP